jgi:chemotaxis-related protein WspD
VPFSLTPTNNCPACKPGDADCWNHIGISGDQSCSELSTIVHCRNCPAFAAAARAFFDRSAPDGYLAEWSQWLAGSANQDTDGTENQDDDLNYLREGISVLIFRLASEWLALRTQTVTEVTNPRVVHQVPHRTNAVFLGLVNVRGQVQPCVSLHGLLGIVGQSVPARLILLRDNARAEAWAFSAEEVIGVRRIRIGRLHGVPSTLANPSVGFSQAVVSWKQQSIGLLDEERVFAALRSYEP